jgi:transposase-like protein
MVRVRIICPKCQQQRFWKTADGRVRCRSCRYIFSPRRQAGGIPRSLLKRVIAEFVLEHSTDIILERTPISKYKLLQILQILRLAMSQEVPPAFEGTVEVDETYLGGTWKNTRLAKKAVVKPKRGRGTFKQPVFGIRCRSGQVWAEVIDSVAAQDLQAVISRQVKPGSVILSDTWKGYTGIAAKGYVHRLVKHEKDIFVGPEGNHINGLEGFWGYLKRKLKAKGGIRKNRLPLYLGEYVWRYNHRSLNNKTQETLLLAMFLKHFRSGN